MSMIKGFLVKGSRAEVIEIEDNLDEYYKLLDCTCIDIVTRWFDNIPFDIICDDEGLLKEKPRPTVFDYDSNPMIFGPIFVVGGADDNGNLVSLTQQQIDVLRNHVFKLFDPYTYANDPKVLVGASYI